MRSVTISKGKKPLTFNEIEAVQFVAQFLEVSEYEVFQLAFNDWYGKRMNNMTMDYRFENYLDEMTMDYRFENYLDEDVVPFWVWTFAKGVIKKYEKDEVFPVDYGIEPMVLTRSQKIWGWFIVVGVGLFALLFSLLARTVQP
jgi:hypothetical protein